jgi:hypothetical protein
MYLTEGVGYIITSIKNLDKDIKMPIIINNNEAFNSLIKLLFPCEENLSISIDSTLNPYKKPANSLYYKELWQKQGNPLG